MSEGVYIILGLVVLAHVVFIAIKIWTRKRDMEDRAYRELYRDIWQDHGKEQRQELIRRTPADFDEPKRKRCQELPGCSREDGHSGCHMFGPYRDEPPTEKLSPATGASASPANKPSPGTTSAGVTGDGSTLR